LRAAVRLGADCGYARRRNGRGWRPWWPYPYLAIVVAMGYTRQAVAIGLIMAGLASYFRDGSVLRFAI
jgi:hypothetical protein